MTVWPPLTQCILACADISLVSTFKGLKYIEE